MCVDSRVIEQFKADIDFILRYKDNWIFNPIFSIVRSLVLLYECTYHIHIYTYE